jgi:hypothetical protein
MPAGGQSRRNAQLMKKRVLSSLLLFASAKNTLKSQNLPYYLPANVLVGWWPFNGNAKDESGNGNHGPANGADLIKRTQIKYFILVWNSNWAIQN